MHRARLVCRSMSCGLSSSMALLDKCFSPDENTEDFGPSVSGRRAHFSLPTYLLAAAVGPDSDAAYSQSVEMARRRALTHCLNALWSTGNRRAAPAPRPCGASLASATQATCSLGAECQLWRPPTMFAIVLGAGYIMELPYPFRPKAYNDATTWLNYIQVLVADQLPALFAPGQSMDRCRYATGTGRQSAGPDAHMLALACGVAVLVSRLCWSLFWSIRTATSSWCVLNSLPPCCVSI